jgi:hypothetical protein
VFVSTVTVAVLRLQVNHRITILLCLWSKLSNRQQNQLETTRHRVSSILVFRSRPSLLPTQQQYEYSRPRAPRFGIDASQARTQQAGGDAASKKARLDAAKSQKIESRNNAKQGEAKKDDKKEAADKDAKKDAPKKDAPKKAAPAKGGKGDVKKESKSSSKPKAEKK